MVPLYVGYDRREACAFHVFNQSVIESTKEPLAIHPLTGEQRDGTNCFTYARFLVPNLQNFEGFALFFDGDMVCNTDIAELWNLRDDRYAVQVVKHDYETRHRVKYIGTPMQAVNEHYPKKNHSSVVLWNCGHPSNRILTEQYVAEATGSHLHRFEWLNDDEIGELPVTWNWLVNEYDSNDDAKLHHYTLGVPGFGNYTRCDSHKRWNNALMNTLNLEGESPSEMVRRAAWRL